jgi:hypothetical protein
MRSGLLLALVGCGRISFEPIEPVFDLELTKAPADLVVDRASRATFVGSDGLIQVAEPDTPRFDHDPITREPRGLLIERTRINLLASSEDLTADPVWFTNASATISGDQAIAPDGTQTADEWGDEDLVLDTRRGQGIAIPDDDLIYTFSVFLRAGTTTLCSFEGELLNGSAQRQLDLDLDLATGTIRRLAPDVESQGIIPYANGWYRVWITIQNTASGNDRALLSVWGDLADDANTGTVFVWGAQIEQGELSSYIPSASANTTRVSDVATLLEVSGPSSDTGTLQAVATIAYADPAARTPIACLDEAICVGRTPDGNAAAAVDGIVVEGAPWLTAKRETAMARWDATELALTFDGTTTTSAATVPQTFTAAQLGHDGTRSFEGHLERVTYWAERLLGN